jgi:LCP family protein required for cell wall assembly
MFNKKKDPVRSSAYTGMLRSVRSREHRRFRWLRKRWVIVTLAVVLVVGGAAGWTLWYYYSLQGDIQVDVANVVPVPREDDPFNALLVGSDSRAGLTEKEQTELGAQDVTAEGVRVTGERADTLILAHVDPETNKVMMVQFPRDLYVPLAGGGRGKINSALEEGKASLVQTVEDLSGLEINVYAQVNIAGFRDLVDAIGGVDVCIPEPIPFDEGTGIEVRPDEVGMVHFNGDRALRFVRSRKVFGEGDFARIQNQQKFLAAAVARLTSPRTFLNFGKLVGIKRAAGRNLKVDSNTDLRELYRLMQRFKSFDPRRYEAYTAPNLGVGTNEAGSVVRSDPATMAALFAAIARNESPMTAANAPRIDPSSIRLGVYNGVNHNRVIAGPAKEELVAATIVNGHSIDVPEIANARRDNYDRTVIRYERDTSRKMARFIKAAIPGARIAKGDVGLGLDLEVIVGDDFAVRRIIRITPIKLPVPGDQPAVCR